MVSEQAVLEALRAVKDPEAQRDIVTLGLVKDLHVHDSEVSFTLAFTTQPPATRATLHSVASRAAGQVPGVTRVQVRMASAQATGRPAAAAPAPPPSRA